MKQTHSFLFLMIFCTILFSQNLKSQSIEASLTAKQFAYNDSLTLVEFFFKIEPQSLSIQTIDSNLVKKIRIGLELFKNDTLQWQDQLELAADANFGSILTKTNLVYTPGDYDINIKISDVFNMVNSIEKRFEFNIENKYEQGFSDIFCFDQQVPSDDRTHPFYKHGMLLYPKYQKGDYLFNIQDSILNYYVEFYQLDTAKTLTLERYIRNSARPFAIKSTHKLESIPNTKLAHIKTGALDLRQFMSGNYELHFSVFDEDKNVLFQTAVPFQKIGSKTLDKTAQENNNQLRKIYKEKLFKLYKLDNTHRLNQLIAAMALLEEKTRRRIFYNAVDNTNLDEKENFFISYWEDKHPLHAEQKIHQFIKRFDVVHKKYGSKKTPGYLSTKGRVELEYGAPDDIERLTDESTDNPYEIWHYYQLKNGQGNIVFVFYDRVQTNKYDLVHSNARGELFNQNWQNLIARQKEEVRE
ncbi:MAG: GWxTD domain-containing protein [Flavobacteriales bacterium]